MRANFGILVLTNACPTGVLEGLADSFADLALTDRDLSLSFPSPKLPDTPSVVRFTIGPNGKASDVPIDSLNDWGMGTLKRGD